MTTKSLGQRLRATRQRTKTRPATTLQELARYFDVSVRTVIRWEQGERLPATEHIERVLSYLQRFDPDLTLSTLLGSKPEPAKVGR